MQEEEFQQALAFARSLRPAVLEPGPGVLVGPSPAFHPPALSDAQEKELLYWLDRLGPFRKGPFSVFGQAVASHWNSDAKWQHCLPFLIQDPAVLEGDVLDHGCNNGYYLFRLLEIKRAGRLLGMDPAPSFYRQFRFLQEMLDPDHPAANIHFLPVGHQALAGKAGQIAAEYSGEHSEKRSGKHSEKQSGSGYDPPTDTSGTDPSPVGDRSGRWEGSAYDGEAVLMRTQDGLQKDLSSETFDAILCWGVIYHRTDPVELLRTIHGALSTGGVLYLESMGIPEDPVHPYAQSIIPTGKYAGAGGIWQVPNARALENLLHRTGFRDIQVLKEWDYSGELNGDTGMPVLQEYLDPNRPGFLKDGLPAPIRILVRARR